MVIKTNADFQTLSEVWNDWIKISENPDCEKKFDWSEDKEVKNQQKTIIPRFLPNPEKNWGPKKGAMMIKHKAKQNDKKNGEKEPKLIKK